MKYNVINAPLIIMLLFFIIFDLAIPPFRFLGSAWLALVILIAITPFYGLDKQVLFKFKKLFILYVVAFIYIVFVIALSGAEEPSYILSFLKSATVMMSSVLFIAVFKEIDIILWVILVFFLNSLICLIFGTFEEWMPIIFFFKHSGDAVVDYVTYRVSSLSGSGYFGISAPYALCTAFLGYYIGAYRNVKVTLLIAFIFISTAGILSGRTAFIGLFLACIFVCRYRLSRGIPILILSISVMFALFNFRMFGAYKDWIFRFILEFMSSESGSTSALNFLDNVSFLPSLSTLLIGDGHYIGSIGGYYGQTDLGYMRFLLFGGVPFTIMSIMFFIVLSIISKDKNYFLVVGITSLILHIKGVVIFNNAAVTAFSILVAYQFCYIKNKT